MGLPLLVWVGGGLLKPVLYFFGNEPSLIRKSPILHSTSKQWTEFKVLSADGHGHLVPVLTVTLIQQ